MSFQELPDLSCDKAIQIGGIDKKTKKANPKQIEGFFIGSRDVESKKSKTGFTKLHVFKTATGTVGVWGKTNLDTQLQSVKLGVMTRVTFVGMVATKNNPMYKYKVQIDNDNVLDGVDLEALQSAGAESSGEDSSGSNYDSGEEEVSAEDFGQEEPEETSLDEEDAPMDEAPPVKAANKTTSGKPAAAGANKTTTEALLAGRRKAA